MPYTVPTSAQFKARFPVYEDLEDAYVDLLLAEASGQVDTSWIEADYQPAIMYLAAHLIATDASGNSGDDEEEADGGDGPISSENFGVLSVTYDTSKGSASSNQSSSGLERTEYGRRYLSLLKKNKPAIVAI